MYTHIVNIFHFGKMIKVLVVSYDAVVCLVLSRIFCSYDRVTIASEGLQKFGNAWHQWPLLREGCSLSCHTCSETVTKPMGHIAHMNTVP